jgi:hypothetical protein
MQMHPAYRLPSRRPEESLAGNHKSGMRPVIRWMVLFDSIIAAHGQLRELCRSLWPVMENQQLVGRERQLSVGLSFIV